MQAYIAAMPRWRSDVGRRLDALIVRTLPGVHQAVQAIEEEAAQIGGRRELADVLDIALPAQQRGGVQGAVLGAMVGVFDPDPETVV